MRNFQRRLHTEAPVGSQIQAPARAKLAPNSGRQLQFQQAADRSAGVRRLTSLQRHANSSQQVAQLTKWKHDGKNWVVESTTNKDKDTHPSPKIQYPYATIGDTYDQDTGEYYSPVLKALKKVRSSKGGIGFYDKRSKTGFAFGSNSSKAGPHTMAHISKRVLMSVAASLGRNLDLLIGSRALPKPRRMNRMLRNRYRDLKDDDWVKDSRTKRTKYLNAYMAVWRRIKRAKTLSEKRAAIKEGMELNPATVYKIAQGFATKAEIKGKGERRTIGVDNIIKLITYQGDIPEDISLKTIDFTGASERETTEAVGMVSDMKNLLQKDEVDQDTGSEEDDSEVDLNSEVSEDDKSDIDEEEDN